MVTEQLSEWASLSEEYQGADILLGNGFSMRFSSAFGYGSLFERFIQTLSHTDEITARSFQTTNFETILEWLSHAHHVNTVLSQPVKAIEEAQALIRNGLANAIYANHPEFGALSPFNIRKATAALADLGDIFTLNYDMILYHIIMDAKDVHEGKPSFAPYNDYFWGPHDQDWLRFMDYQNYTKYKHVYYLHGALFLFHDDYLDLKLKASRSADLRNTIGTHIRRGRIPLFVSEGTSDEKLRAISRSDYLRFATGKLEERRKGLVIFGASLSSQDDHIAASIRRRTNRVAYAVYRGGKSQQVIDAEVATVRKTLGGLTVDIFDADTLFA